MITIIDHWHWRMASGATGTRVTYIRLGLRRSASFGARLGKQEIVDLIEDLNRQIKLKEVLGAAS